MEKFNLHGITWEVDGNLQDILHLIGPAMQDLQSLKARSPGLNVMRFERPEYWEITSVHGKDVIKIISPPPEEEKVKQIIKKETVIEEPTPVYCLEYYPNFVGFYICLEPPWKPVIFKGPIEDRASGYSTYDDLNPDGKLNQYIERFDMILKTSPNEKASAQVFELDEIGTPDLEESWSSDDSYDGGGYFTPGITGFNPPSWWYEANAQADNGNAFARIYDPIDANDGLFVSNLYAGTGNGQIGIFASQKSICIADFAPWDVFYGETYEYGCNQTFSRTYGESTSGGVSLVGNEIETYSFGSDTSYTGIANACGGSSSSTYNQKYWGTEVTIFESAVVRDTEGYIDDTVMIALYQKDIWNTDYTETHNPWAYAPFFNTHQLHSPPHNQEYRAWIKTPDYEMDFEIVEPELQTYNLNKIDIFQCSIFDFHGEPVFIFIVYDYRPYFDDDGNAKDIPDPYEVRYCMVFKEQIFWSETFEILGQDFEIHRGYRYHNVENNERYGGYGSCAARAVSVTKKNVIMEEV